MITIFQEHNLGIFSPPVVHDVAHSEVHAVGQRLATHHELGTGVQPLEQFGVQVGGRVVPNRNLGYDGAVPGEERGATEGVQQQGR